MIWKRIDTFVYATESLSCTPETNTALTINYDSGCGLGAKSCPTLCGPLNSRLPGSPAHGIS